MPPLAYDDEPGSWCRQSEGWPSIAFDTDHAARAAYFACQRKCGVPYGSYVLVDKTLRLETEDYKKSVEAFVASGGWEKFEPTGCDLCNSVAMFRHPDGGFRCGKCPRPGDASCPT